MRRLVAKGVCALFLLALVTAGGCSSDSKDAKVPQKTHDLPDKPAAAGGAATDSKQKATVD